MGHRPSQNNRIAKKENHPKGLATQHQRCHERRAPGHLRTGCREMLRSLSFVLARLCVPGHLRLSGQGEGVLSARAGKKCHAMQK